MELSTFEKLALTMLTDICEKLGATQSVDPKLIKDAISSGNLWAIDWKYRGLSVDPLSEITVREVADILNMWLVIEKAGGRKFPGIDGNHDPHHASAARFMMDHIDHFQQFRGRASDAALHLEDYRRMLKKFEQLKPELSDRTISGAEIDELVAVPADQGYPFPAL